MPPADELKIQWLGQAGFLLASSSFGILIDPWFTPHPDRLVPPPAISDVPPQVVALLATHEHADHLDLASLPTLVRRCPHLRVVLPEPLGESVRDCIEPIDRVTGVRPGDRFRLGENWEVLATPAWHGVTVSDGYTDGGWAETGTSRFVGYVIRTPRATVYHAGDTILDPRLLDFLKPLGIDVALLPINGRDESRERLGIVGNLDAADALALASCIGAKVLVPMHYDMVRGNVGSVSALVELAEKRESGPRVWCLQQGRSYQLVP